MKIHIASHYGMCFGVRDALRDTHEIASNQPTTVLGHLVHNPLVHEHLRSLGVREGKLDRPSNTKAVVITAHGAADSVKSAWKNAGHELFDTTCPLVRKAHRSLECLVLAGYHPVVIGERNHVEVQGLITDLPNTTVILSDQDISTLPVGANRIGIISQTTQPIDRVTSLVDQMKGKHPDAEIRFVDTVCQPTKQRQDALRDLCNKADIIVVVGGKNSNNTGQLAEKARQLGCIAYQIERPEEINPQWFEKSENVGVTAGTSTLDETVHAVAQELRRIAKNKDSRGFLKVLGTNR